MSDESFDDRVSRVFAEVVGLPEEQRGDRLAELCDGDERLISEVCSLLQADSRADGFLGSSVADSLSTDERGRSIGRYELDEKIGEGGMGVVYLAHRADGAYEQQVVVKLMKGAAVNTELVRRFHTERQVLAALNHPNIARLLDGGVSDGHPYLVMEYVEGRDILEYCDQEKLGIDARLRLFDAVCAGVQHAHANLVVHRDLKPAHIVIDHDGNPKLLDFGIAAMLDDEGHAGATLTVERRLTPQYASPEQVRGEPITTSTDVYSLGLILYELLGGRRAYTIEHGSSDADRRLICETVPLPPSRQLSDTNQASPAVAEIAEARGIAGSRLRRMLAGDLDTIVMTALRKEPDRRYASAEALREDLRRYRAGLPIGARPDSVSYRVSKFASRHRAGVVAAALILLLLIGGIVATSWQARIASERRAEAEAALATSDTVGRFLRSVLLAAAPREMGQNVTMREAIDRAAERIEEELADAPPVEARVREAIGATYRLLGEQSDAQVHLERAVDLVRNGYDASDTERARIEHELAILRTDQGRFEDAVDIYETVYRLRMDALGPEHRDTLESRKGIGTALNYAGRAEEAYPHMIAVAEARETLFGANDPQTLIAKKSLVPILLELGRPEEAVVVAQEVYKAQAETIGANHPDTLITANDIGIALKRLERYEESVGWFERALSGLSEHFPAGSIDVAVPRRNLATTFARLGRHDEAIEMLTTAITDAEPVLGEDHYVVSVFRADLGRSLNAVGRHDEAGVHAERAAAALRDTFGPDHRYTQAAIEVLEEARTETGTQGQDQ